MDRRQALKFIASISSLFVSGKLITGSTVYSEFDYMDVEGLCIKNGVRVITDDRNYLPFFNDIPITGAIKLNAKEGWVDVFTSKDDLTIKRIFGKAQILKRTPERDKAFSDISNKFWGRKI